MKDYRLVMVSTEPQSDYWFVIYSKAMTQQDAVNEANKNYIGFEVDLWSVTEVMG